MGPWNDGSYFFPLPANIEIQRYEQHTKGETMKIFIKNGFEGKVLGKIPHITVFYLGT